jgi:2-phospho-L-lactate guanylyltransferase
MGALIAGMKTCAIVPVKKFENSKSRLSTLLRKEERAQLSLCLLEDTLETLMFSQQLSRIIVVASDPLAEKITESLGLECLLQCKDEGVNSAVKFADRFLNRAGSWISIIVPSDLPLMLSKDVDLLCQITQKDKPSVTICPSREFNGTNLLVRSPSQIISDTKYDDDSFMGHLQASIQASAITKVIFAHRIMIDLDTPKDLELIFHRNIHKKSVSYLKRVPKILSTFQQHQQEL